MQTSRKTQGLDILVGVVFLFFAFQTVLKQLTAFSGGIMLQNFPGSLVNFFRSIPFFFRSLPPYVRVSMFLRAGTYLFLSVCAFRCKRDALPFAGAVLMLVCSLILLYPQLRAPLYLLLPLLFGFLADVLLTAGAQMIMLKKGTGLLKKLWFIPAISAFIAALVPISINLENEMPVMIVLFRQGGIVSILAVSVYLLFGLWLVRDALTDSSDPSAMAAQKYAQLNYYYDLYMKGAITAAEYEAKRRQIQGF